LQQSLQFNFVWNSLAKEGAYILRRWNVNKLTILHALKDINCIITCSTSHLILHYVNFTSHLILQVTINWTRLPTSILLIILRNIYLFTSDIVYGIHFLLFAKDKVKTINNTSVGSLVQLIVELANKFG
jgi:hypothetical protein